jgi:tetratricopeptide (TPR) repeat protein
MPQQQEETMVFGSLLRIKREFVVAGAFRTERRGLFACILIAAVLPGLSAGSGHPATPAKTSSAQEQGFSAIATDIENAVTRLGYGKSTADDLVRLVRGWKLGTWREKLAHARSASSVGKVAEIVAAEEDAAKWLYAKIRAEITPCGEDEQQRYFYLSAVVKDKKAQCLGYSQVFYILGNSIGLRVTVKNVLEMAYGSLLPGNSHVACLIALSDSHHILVDVSLRLVSKPFVFQDAYLAAGRCWELKLKDNSLGIHRRIQLLNESGVVSLLYNNLGLNYDVAGQRDRSILFLTRAIELNPEHAEAFNNRGTVYGMLGQHAQALSDFTKAIELNPRNARAFYNRGIEYKSLRQYQQAISDYTKAIELNPRYAEAFCNRGNAYVSLGRHQQALADYTKSIELNPKNANAYGARGAAYAAHGMKDEARADLRKARELNPALGERIRNISDQFKLGL